jgi:4-amino-4-deoxy-L-arabinose transferase-like glycosyltransferase
LHLGTALEYGSGPIDLLRPVIVGFSANGAPTAQEPPLWQAAVGLIFKLTGSKWYGWANLVSLAAFGAGLWPFFQLGRHYLGERAAWWALVFLLAQPVIVFASGLGSTDGFCLTLTLWFLYFADKLIRSEAARWLLPTAVFACLGAISKLPFFMAAAICSVGLLVINHKRGWRPWALLAAAGAAAGLAFIVWTRYTNSLLAQVEYPYQELRLSHNPGIVFWFFGDWHYRLSPGVWLKGGWRFLHATLGSLPLIVLLAAALLRPGNGLPKLWLAATFITTLIFTHLVLVHWHYYLMCCPAVALLCGATLARWEDFWAQEMPRQCLRLGLAGAALALSAVDGVIAMKVSIYYDGYPKAMSEIIRQSTKPEDKLVMYGGDWGGEELFRAGRKGFYVCRLEGLKQGAVEKGLFDLLGSEADLRRLKELGYTRLVLMSESPVRFAAVAVNPGSQRKRELYPAAISSAVDGWPVVYKSEDILIKEIP